jgi:phosphoenolpyruvate carboxykinase (GTP)
MRELLTVHVDEWRAEVPLIREHFAQFAERLPAKLAAAIDDLEARLH